MKKNIRILFVGNSLTYYNFLPAKLHDFFAAVGIEADCVMLTASGKCMDYHVKQSYTSYNILYGHYDYVILQGIAMGFEPETFVRCGKQIYDDFISKTDAKTVLHVSYARKDERKKQPEMTAAYLELARQTGAIVAPVGEAFGKVLRMRPAPEIYCEDKNHPSPAGTYLAAATLFYAIMGRERMLRLPKTGGLYEKCGLDRKTALTVNRIACEMARRYAE